MTVHGLWKFLAGEIQLGSVLRAGEIADSW